MVDDLINIAGIFSLCPVKNVGHAQVGCVVGKTSIWGLEAAPLAGQSPKNVWEG